MILGEHVTLEAGTGAVHTAPDHGVDDFQVSRHYGLELLDNVDDNGLFRQRVELFGGEHVMKVDDHLLEELRTRGRLVYSEKYQHSYPFCWRTKTPIIFRATPQWFISMDDKSLRDGHDGCDHGRALDSGVGPVTHRRHDRQPAGLVHLAATLLGGAHSAVPAP